MRGLTRVLTRDQRERGAVATIVATLLAGGVIMGMLAVSIDLGNLTYERRQVQNAADATSLALAADCAAGADECQPSAVEDLLGANSHDNLGQYDNRPEANAPNGVCGREAGSLPLCSSEDGTGDIADLLSCPPLPDWLRDSEISYVETYAATKTTNGDDENALFLPFSRVLAGGDPSGDKGTSACARAAWGPAGSTGPTLPLVIGLCDWANKTSEGGVPGQKYAPSPPYTPEGNGSMAPAVPKVIADGGYATGIFAHTSDDNKCSDIPGSPGLEYPGGFGWLSNSDCVATIDVDDMAVGAPGGSETCSESQLKKYVGTEVFIPIYDNLAGKKGPYRIVGVASFYLAGWHAINGGSTYEIYKEPSGVCTGKCNPSVSYVWGWFTSGQLPVGSIKPGAGDFGVTIIQPAG